MQYIKLILVITLAFLALFFFSLCFALCEVSSISSAIFFHSSSASSTPEIRMSGTSVLRVLFRGGLELCEARTRPPSRGCEDPRLMVVVGLVWLTQDCSEHTDTDMLTRWRHCRYFYLFLCKSIRLPDPDPPWRGLGHGHGGQGTGGHWWLCGGARRVVFTLYTLHTVCLCKPFCVHY